MSENIYILRETIKITLNAGFFEHIWRTENEKMKSELLMFFENVTYCDITAWYHKTVLHKLFLSKETILQAYNVMP